MTGSIERFFHCRLLDCHVYLLANIRIFTVYPEDWKRGIRKTIILVTAISSIITSISVIHYWHLRGNHQDINIFTQQEMANFLVDNGYEYGFASFWYCNSTIQLSNGKWWKIKVNHIFYHPLFFSLQINFAVQSPNHNQIHRFHHHAI